jgi:hypothetical protein
MITYMDIYSTSTAAIYKSKPIARMHFLGHPRDDLESAPSSSTPQQLAVAQRYSSAPRFARPAYTKAEIRRMPWRPSWDLPVVLEGIAVSSQTLEESYCQKRISRRERYLRGPGQCLHSSCVMTISWKFFIDFILLIRLERGVSNDPGHGSEPKHLLPKSTSERIDVLHVQIRRRLVQRQNTALLRELT